MLQRAIAKSWFISQYCNADWLVGTASVAIFNHFSTKNKLFELQLKFWTWLPNITSHVILISSFNFKINMSPV
jgi:hypothetical protein